MKPQYLRSPFYSFIIVTRAQANKLTGISVSLFTCFKFPTKKSLAFFFDVIF